MEIILFADKLPPNIGGMETHAKYFVDYFSKKVNLSIITVINKKIALANYKYDVIKEIDLISFLNNFTNKKTILFFNSGYFIEEFLNIRKLLPNCKMLYRTGGNEINKAPLSLDIKSHKERQNYWINQINNSIDYLITNSKFTNKRLLELGVKSELLYRVGGGVDLGNLKNSSFNNGMINLITCCRFVPYKNISYMIDALSLLTDNNIKMWFVGGGPLEQELKEQAKNLTIKYEFSGIKTNEEALEMISKSDIYLQTSVDLLTQVEGGSYIHTEGMGRSLLEAITLDVPIVATDCGAISEYVDKKVDIIVNGDFREFYNGITTSIDRLNKNITKHNEFDYSFNTIFNKYEELFNE